MEDCLVLRTSGIRLNGQLPPRDEKLTPTIENTIMMDWLEAIGGTNLVEQVYQKYAGDLKTHVLIV